MSRSAWAKKIDRVWKAKKPGKRTTSWGSIYYENRINRSDKKKLEENNDMYLQLADNNTDVNYTPVETTEGTFMIRNDLMSEDVTLSAAKGAKVRAFVQKAAPVVKKVATGAVKVAGAAAPLVIPGGAAVKVGSKILTNPKTVAAIKKGVGALKTLKPIAKKVETMPAAAGAIPAAIVAAEATQAAKEMEQATGNKFTQFVSKYKWPLIIGAAGLTVGGILLARRKKSK